MPQTDPEHGARPPLSVLAVLRTVLALRPGAAVALVLGALTAGIAESTILALVADTATAMVDGLDPVEVALGPVELEARVSVLLIAAALLGTLRVLLQVGLAYLPALIAGDAQASMRNRLFDAYSRSAWEVQAEERDGHLQELVTNQVGQATQALLMSTTLVSAGLTFLTLVATAFVLGPGAAVLVLVVAAALAAVLRPLARWGRQHAAALSTAQILHAESVGSSIRLAEETYTFGTADAERRRLRERVALTRHHFLRQQFASRLTQGLYQGLVILLLVAGLAVLHASGTGRVASLGAIVLILVRASSYGQQAQVAWQVVQQAGPYLERLAAAEDRFAAHPQRSGDRPYPSGTELRLEAVSFAYRPGRPVLQGVDLYVAGGAVVGIVGRSGAGKSTLVQLLLRMRRPTTGAIELGGIPVEEISLDEWRRHVAYVPQEPRLVHATVAENISFSRDLDSAAIERAARLAHIHDDIVAMPEGYDTVIGQRADAVSGGQRQRICLARALAGAPDILVLDEPTSALDAASEAAIRASLLELRDGPTIFIVAHRPALLEICDQLLEIEPVGSEAMTSPGDR